MKKRMKKKTRSRRRAEALCLFMGLALLLGLAACAAPGGGPAATPRPSAPAVTPAATAAQTDGSVRYGERSSAVASVQQKLIALGYLKDKADAYWGYYSKEKEKSERLEAEVADLKRHIATLMPDEEDQEEGGNG